jgi:general nucleoside transport system permease protein
VTTTSTERITWRRFEPILIPLASVVVAFLIGSLLIVAQGADPVRAYQSLFQTALGSPEGWGRTLGRATPLVLAGLAVALGIRVGLFNIGAQGQLLFGALAAAVVGYKLTGLPLVLHVPLALLTGAVIGGLYGLIPGLLKAYRGVHEVISTIMLNSIALALIDWLVFTQFREPGQPLTRTPAVAESARLGKIGTLPLGFFLAVAIAFAIWWYMRRTVGGFKLETVGRSKPAAWYSGISVKMATIIGMGVGGALAGLGGAIETLGVTGRYEPGFNMGLGFDGITIALLGRANPIGIIPGALLIAAMRVGGPNMQFDAGVAPEIVDVLVAITLFLVSAPLLAKLFRRGTTGIQQNITTGWGS